MLAIFQFPISDTRLFISESSSRLPVPDWPNPTTDIKPQFVNYFGKAVERRTETDHAWPDEIKFCLASRALRFDNLARHHAGQTGKRFRPQCVFRRLFCDGKCLVRVEIGLKNNKRYLLFNLNPQEVLSIIIDLCDLPTFIPQANLSPKKNKLLKQGPTLAKLYATGTTSSSCRTEISKAEKLVETGNPLIILELESFEADFPLIPDGFVSIPADKALGANLAYGRLKTRSGIVSTWILQQGKSTQNISRSLRLNLLRLHAEQEALDLMLKQIHRKNIPINSEQVFINELDEYFKEKTKLINRSKWGGIYQSAILSAFDACEQVTKPSNRLNMIDRYEGTHRQIWNMVEDYQIRRASIRVVPVIEVKQGGITVNKNVTLNQSGTGNIANISEFMSNITNQINNNLEKSASTDEVKILMQQLADQIKSISDKIDPKQIKRMGNDLETISKEMTLPEPRKEWYELSIKGLKEAAEAVGEIAVPIIATLKKLIPILL